MPINPRSYQTHSPWGSQAERMSVIRESAYELAKIINENTPPSREQSLALTKLEEAAMWASKAICVNEAPTPVE